MSPGRGRLLALLGVVVLAAAALAVGLDRDDPATAPRVVQTEDPALVGLRQTAALAPCPPGLGADFPELVLPCLGGGPAVDLTAQPPGRPTLVNVWGSWCGPCVEEVPDLVAFRERAGDRVGLVGVLTSDSLRSALTFAPQFGMTWNSVVDDDGLVLRAFAPGPPITLFVTADGDVVHQKTGAFRDTAEVEALVAEHLGVVL